MRRWFSFGTGAGLIVILSGNLAAQGSRAGAVAGAQAAKPVGAQAAAAPSSHSVRWVAASGGVIPDGAMASGQDAGGTQEFACRAAVVRGTHLGRIAAGMTGCSIGFGGREVIMPTYEVLAVAASSQAAAATVGGQLGERA